MVGASTGVMWYDWLTAIIEAVAVVLHVSAFVFRSIAADNEAVGQCEDINED